MGSFVQKLNADVYSNFNTWAIKEPCLNAATSGSVAPGGLTMTTALKLKAVEKEPPDLPQVSVRKEWAWKQSYRQLLR